MTHPIVPLEPGVRRGRAALAVRPALRRAGALRDAYGYEAMALVLDTLRRAGDRANERTYVAELVRRARRPVSVLGPYAIEADGDNPAGRSAATGAGRPAGLRARPSCATGADSGERGGERVVQLRRRNA